MSETLAGGLRASRVSWKRLRRLGLNCAIAVTAAAVTAFYIDGGPSAFLLRAEGFVTQDHRRVSAPYESRVVEVFVRPGDHVSKGQKLALITSPAINRSLSDLSVEKARLVSRIAELRTRQQVISQVLPMAQRSSHDTTAYLTQLTRASAAGLAVNKSLQEMSAASVNTADKVASLIAERDAIDPELTAQRAALAETEAAAQVLRDSYNNGVLTADATGTIGEHVAQVGEMLGPNGGGFANIYTGDAFVMAYLPDSYRRPISKGESVRISTPTATVTGRVEALLPIAETLPADYQRPNRIPERGRLVRIELTGPTWLPLDQHVEISSCWTDNCHKTLFQAAWEQLLAYAQRNLALGKGAFQIAARVRELLAGPGPLPASRTTNPSDLPHSTAVLTN